MYTVCGHAQPHQARPTSAVTNATVTKMLSMSNIKRTPSVARNVRPPSTKCRFTTSSKTTGLPPMLKNGRPTNNAIKHHPSVRRARCKRPA